MKRVIVICEGPTEQEFCKDILFSHFFDKGIHIQAPLIKKSAGGIVPWNILQRQIENHLVQDTKSVVTTFIDYYGLKDKHLFPGWDSSKKNH